MHRTTRWVVGGPLTRRDFLISTAAIASVAAMSPAFAQLPASITDMTGVELGARAIRSPPGLVPRGDARYLDRIERGQPAVNAIVTLRDRGRAAAPRPTPRRRARARRDARAGCTASRRRSRI